MLALRSLLSLAASAAAVHAQAAAVRYAPGEHAYAVTTVIKHTDARGEQKQAYTVTAQQRMKLLLTARDAQTLRFP